MNIDCLGTHTEGVENAEHKKIVVKSEAPLVDESVVWANLNLMGRKQGLSVIISSKRKPSLDLPIL